MNGFVAGCLLATAALPLAAQDARDAKSRVPDSFTPPAGMCRLWIEGVPASQQPAVTDCASALRNRSSTATVVFGPAKQRGESNEWRPFGSRNTSEMVRSYSPSGRGRDETTAKRDEIHAREEARFRDEARSREEARTGNDSRSRVMSDPATKTATPATAPTSTPAPAPRKPEKPQ